MQISLYKTAQRKLTDELKLVRQELVKANNDKAALSLELDVIMVINKEINPPKIVFSLIPITVFPRFTNVIRSIFQLLVGLTLRQRKRRV